MDENGNIRRPTYSRCDSVSVYCPVEGTVYGSYFNSGACIFFIVAYAVLLSGQFILGLRARTWSFSIWLGIGTICEVMGYASRIALIDNPWNFGPFVIQLVTLVLGPTFVAAAISITFKYLVLWYGSEWSVLRASLLPWLLVGTDLFSLVIQAAGGIVSAVATGTDNASLLQVGSDVLTAGVVFQLANMVGCGGYMVIYYWRRWKSRSMSQKTRVAENAEGYPSALSEDANNGAPRSERTRFFVYVIITTYILIIVRCIYRVPETSGGWGSSLMQNETLFLILDGAMVLLSIAALTIFHPFFCFGYMTSRYAKDESGSQTESYEEHDMQPLT